MVVSSPVVSDHLAQLSEHRLNGAGGGAHCGEARRTQGDEPARLAAALGPRIAEVGRYQPLGFEPLQRRVDVGAPDRSSSLLLDVLGDRDGIGLGWTQPQRRKQDQELEFGEGLCRCAAFKSLCDYLRNAAVKCSSGFSSGRAVRNFLPTRGGIVGKEKFARQSDRALVRCVSREPNEPTQSIRPSIFLGSRVPG